MFSALYTAFIIFGLQPLENLIQISPTAICQKGPLAEKEHELSEVDESIGGKNRPCLIDSH
jgi:hypothetical protein